MIIIGLTLQTSGSTPKWFILDRGSIAHNPREKVAFASSGSEAAGLAPVEGEWFTVSARCGPGPGCTAEGNDASRSSQFRISTESLPSCQSAEPSQLLRELGEHACRHALAHPERSVAECLQLRLFLRVVDLCDARLEEADEACDRILVRPLPRRAASVSDRLRNVPALSLGRDCGLEDGQLPLVPRFLRHESGAYA
jgi:hypothetical protein